MVAHNENNGRLHCKELLSYENLRCIKCCLVATFVLFTRKTAGMLVNLDTGNQPPLEIRTHWGLETWFRMAALSSVTYLRTKGFGTEGGFYSANKQIE